MGRAPCSSKVGLHRGQWTPTEDSLLATYIQTHGEGQWRSLPTNAGLLRCGKSCRLRWMNYLRPGIKRGNISPDEDDLIIKMHTLLGNRWSLIAGRLPDRTDNEIKNYWNTHLSKKLRNRKTDPNTQKKISSLDHDPPNPKCKPLPTKSTTTTQKHAIIPKPADDTLKVVLHQPKAIRVNSSLIVSSLSLSPPFLARNSSFESTLTAVSPTLCPPNDLWGPMDEDRIRRFEFLIGADEDDDVEPPPPHTSSDLDKLYNEYFQLLNHQMDHDQARELDPYTESLLI